MSANNRISNLIESQVPHFVRNDHPTFVRFLECYYEYLEQSGKALERLKNIKTFRDIDQTEDEFALKLYSEFLKNIPEDVQVDRKLLLKHIKDFYRAKGTEKATKFLMRILFNKEVEIYYPKMDVLRASDGKWFVQKSLRITDTRIANVSNTNLSGLEKYVGTQIQGQSSNTTALVERVDRFYEQGTQIDELILSNIDGEFDSGERVWTNFNDGPSTKLIVSNIFSGIISSITIINGGTDYLVGDPVIILSNIGAGACAVVASVSTGDITAINVVTGGAGYKEGRTIVFSGGGGSGANAIIGTVSLDETIHPNTYNIVSSTISLEANTALSNAIYSNLNASNANTSIANAVSYWSYTNTGPVTSATIISAGTNYTSEPTMVASANTQIYALGILGRMEIVSGGTNYRANDAIEFINPTVTYGVGAQAKVLTVDPSTNAITAVRFTKATGHLTGGAGYDPLNLPRANVLTSTGSGANIQVTAILGAGATFDAITSSIGTIQRIVILNRGFGYNSATTANLIGSGDGTANVRVTTVEGVYTYPGRYLNDDGHISSYNFLQDRDFYQDFSYVIRSSKSIDDYRKTVKNTVHPAGTKLFGEFLYVNEDAQMINLTSSNVSVLSLIKSKTYVKTQNTVNISYASHNVTNGSTISLEFTSGTGNLRNGLYITTSTNPSFLRITHPYFLGNTSGNVLVGITRG